MLNKQDILKELNPEQQIAVQDINGPKFLVAGPGSGKTKVLISRTQYMLLSGIKPENILLFTFTNKAAKEIKQRISSALGESISSKITTGTYHSFCCRLLRQYGKVLGYKKGWSIYDSEDSKKLLMKITKGLDVNSNIVQSYISNMKRRLTSPASAIRFDEKNQEFANLYFTYQSTLIKQNAMDFDDLIFNAIKLLKNNPDIHYEVSNSYKYISADESHDSSPADIELIRLLSSEHNNVCFILDDHQSIYGFRGADLKAVLNIKNIFPDLVTHCLNRNYRSTKNIVEASKSLISHNKKHFKKEIFTENPTGDKIILFEEKNPQFESIRIAKMIMALVKNYHYKYSDIAILYRTSNLSRQIEETFLKYHLPYEILSGINFYSRKEIKDLLSFIRFVSNPYDLEAFERIINIPKRGLGEKSLERIYDQSSSTIPPTDALTACKNILKNDIFKGKNKKGLENFVSIIDTLNSKKDDVTVPEFLDLIIKLTNYDKYLSEEFEKEYTDKIDNVNELKELSHNFLSIEDFLEQTSLDRKDDNENDDKVQLLTMHMSKGLEWKAVFIIGANEGTNPHFRSLAFPAKIEEERRLFYVAMTRAEKNLIICRPDKIQINGHWQLADRSRFIDEIDSKYIYNPLDK